MFWTLLTYVAWGISALIVVYLLMDAIRVGKEYDEDLLISSREGTDELLKNEQSGVNSDD